MSYEPSANFLFCPKYWPNTELKSGAHFFLARYDDHSSNKNLRHVETVGLESNSLKR